jgi:peptide/nickel transport system substrate-binding protein
LPSYSIFNIGNEAYDPAQRDFAYDPKAARDLIAKAGYKDGEIRFTIITDEANQSIIEWIQRDLGAVGIKVDIVSQEWLVYTSNLGKLAPDVALFAMEWGFITPYWLKLVYNGYVVARGGGEGAISSDLGPAVTQAAEATDRTQAIALWKAANAIFQREAGIVPLVTFMRYFTTGANLRGFNVPEQNFYDLTPVWFEK